MEASVGHERQLNLQQQALSEIGPISGIGLPLPKILRNSNIRRLNLQQRTLLN